ncbi:MAG: DUF2892 domain-containing protein [Leptospiraceae bacterium]|nr:DUF2892 domain-containing protein [Leptospiraceae bacterium]
MYLANTGTWHLDRLIRLLAGVFSLVGVGLGYFHSPYWFILNLLVGVNLIVFALTGFCIMTNILYLLGVRPACSNS